MKKYYSLSEVADILSVSKETLRRWDRNGKLIAIRHPINNYRVYPLDSLKMFEQLGFLFDESIDYSHVKPIKKFNVIELFSGAGGLALGLDRAGLNCELLNDIDHWSCETLKLNRPSWNVIELDIKELRFDNIKKKIDVVTGGFPCQAFSYAGKKLGFKDTRGTMFYEYARAVNELKPLICVAENVRGLLKHDDGKTIRGMSEVLDEIGYDVLPPKLLKAIFYKVPQKRERLILVGLRKSSKLKFDYPPQHKILYTVKDALKKGELFDCDVPKSDGYTYPDRKKKIMSKVPPGGYWKDLPDNLQREYMKKSYYLGGGKTGMARRMSWDEPCLTLTCNPSQMQTERCHPEEDRPFTVREYARIQTFPDTWEFSGSTNQQYKQIGNAVPVNLGYHIGQSIVKCLNNYEINKK